jgi:hypothetical protein
MALTPEQLQRYWDANPQALQQAVMSNPGMFGQDISGGTPTLQLTEKLTPLELLKQENLARNAANPVPEGFDPASLSNTGGVPLWQMGGGFGPATAAAGLNTIDRIPKDMPFSEYLTSGHATLQQMRNDKWNLGGTVTDDTAGKNIDRTQGGLSPELSAAVRDAFNKAGQEYTDAMVAYFNNEPGAGGFSHLRPDYYKIFEEMTGLPREYTREDGALMKFNIISGEYEGTRGPKDGFMGSLVKNAPALIGAATGNPWLAAAGSGFVSARDGGNFEDILKAAAIGGLTTSVGGAGNSGVNAAGVANPSGLFGGMTEGAIRSGLEAGTREAIRGGISGDFDIGNIAQAALTGGAVKGATDFVNDSIDTSAYTDANLEKWEKAGLITADEADELAALYQKSSVGALFGPNAFLNNTFGVGSELISTKPFDDVLNTISSGVDFLLDNPVGNAIANSPITKGLLNAAAKLMGVANPSPQEVKDFMNNNYDLNPNNPNYNYERARLDRDLALREFEYGPNYNLETLEQEGEVLKLGDEQFNEEFFVEDAERSEDSPVSGTHYSNPFGSTPPPQSNSTTPTTATGGEAPLPQQESEDKRIQQVLEEYWRNNPEALDEAIAANPDAFGVDPELISGQTPDGDLPNVAEDPLPSDANEEELLGMGGVDYTLPPSISDYNSTGSIEDDLPPSGGGGGALPESSSNGGLMGKGDFQEFMAGISYMLPVIQQMGIPMEDFMKMWMNNR